MQERWEGFGGGAKAVLQGRLDAALAGAAAIPLSRGLEVRPEFGTAIEALLGSAAEAISVSDVGTAQRILAQLERDQIGSAILRIAELRRPAPAAVDLPRAWPRRRRRCATLRRSTRPLPCWRPATWPTI